MLDQHRVRCDTREREETITLHLFEKQTSMSFVGPDGKPLPPTGTPAPGDHFSVTDDDYVGNHKHHAKSPTASAHIECTITSPTSGLCSAQGAIGGSMLLASDFTIDLTAPKNAPSTVAINGGTGRYKHAHGTISIKPVGNTNNDDTTITFTT